MLAEHQKGRKYFSEAVIWKLAFELCSAVSYLHSKSIIHRDLKTNNVFLTYDHTVKLGDLGEAKAFSTDTLEPTKAGTPLYMSPELVQRQPYCSKVDTWALGCILYQVAALRPPFRGDNLIQLGVDIVKTDPPTLPKFYSQRLRTMVMLMLTKKRQGRPTVGQVLGSFPPSVTGRFQPEKGRQTPVVQKRPDSLPRIDQSFSKETESSVSPFRERNQTLTLTYTRHVSNRKRCTIRDIRGLI